MRVLVVIDKPGTAIHRLAVERAKYMPWHQIKIVPFHPKRPSGQQVIDFREGYEWCDIVDFQYWKSAEKIRETFEIKKPCLLAHYNPYDVTKQTWEKYQINVVVNQTQQRLLQNRAQLIPLPVDLQYWQAKEAIEKKYDVIMVSNRIEAKKGILPVAQVCQDLGLNLLLVGSISDLEYYQQVINTGVVTFFEKIPDEELRAFYNKSRLHVCNSIDNFESGTLPILEAISMDVPVVTRKVGHVPDIFNGRNMIVRAGDPNDKEDLKAAIQKVLADPDAAKTMAEDAKYSIKYRNYEINAWEYSKLYHQLLQKNELVSVIIPIVGNDTKGLAEKLARLQAQTYGPSEVVIVHDGGIGDVDVIADAIKEIKAVSGMTIKFSYCRTVSFIKAGGMALRTYGLARARNIGILEAEGEWLMFLDDRLLPDVDAIEKFYDRRAEGKWLWGIKDGKKKSFVENFSFVKRSDVIKLGMFNERITQYGGMTQDIRTRAERFGKMKLELVESAKATATRKSSRKGRYLSIVKSKTQCYKLYG